MVTVDSLKACGANVEEGLGRCMGNEAFYLRLVGMGLCDPNFDRLDEAVKAGNAKAAFEAAHALKGAIGNLSLTPIFNPLSAITEKLRGQTAMADIDALYTEMTEALGKFRSLAD